MRLRIAVCDPDTEYARRLAGLIGSGEAAGTAGIAVCTRPELLAEWMAAGRCDLYIVGAEWAEEIGPAASGGGAVVWIGENEGGTGPNGEPVWSRYMGGPEWASRLSGLLRRQEPHGGESPSPVVGIWSPGGGAGRTTLIAHLAKLRTERGLRTFAVGIDPGTVRGEAEEHDLSDWLFRIKAGTVAEPDPAQPPAEEREAFSGALLQTFSGDSSYFEWCAVGAAEGERLLDAAAGAVRGGMVLADAGAGWSWWAETVWKRSAVIVCLIPEDALALSKAERWFAGWPEWREGGAFRNKALIVMNRCLSPGARSEAAPRTPGALRLPYVPEWKQDAERTDPEYQLAAMRLLAEVEAACAAR